MTVRRCIAATIIKGLKSPIRKAPSGRLFCFLDVCREPFRRVRAFGAPGYGKTQKIRVESV
jgi:hypothetical protein